MNKNNVLINLLIIISLFFATACRHSDDKVIIIHTNDTHSQIEPDDKDRGGVARRKVLIDSIRAEHPYALLVDAGDAVQGTLYFTIYKGEVERVVMNELGYDIVILGNHEFDNGIDAIAKQYRQLNAEKISSNYDFGSTGLDTLFSKYVIKEINGHKIGFIGINLNPQGMIDESNCEGITYQDGLAMANETAEYLKSEENVDVVIAMTHVGYYTMSDNTPSDLDIARNSKYLDVIIGAHSHTIIDPKDENTPEYKIPNLDGDTVLIVQTGKAGRNIGEITIDFNESGYQITPKLIAVNNRLDNKTDAKIEELLKPYRNGVDSLMALKVATSAIPLKSSEPALLNFITDFVELKGEELVGRQVDIAIMNKGGIRQDLPQGDITEGQIINTFPFGNRIYVMEIKGADLIDAFDVMARRGGDGVSAGVEVLFQSDDSTQTGKYISATINGKPIIPEQTYTLATIDYLANGGDYMTPLTNGKLVAKSSNILYEDLLDYLRKQSMGNPINPHTIERMHK